MKHIYTDCINSQITVWHAAGYDYVVIQVSVYY